MNNSKLEIAEHCGDEEILNSLMKNYFYNLNSIEQNAIFPYLINLGTTSSDLKFCNIPIIRCWALKIESSCSIFMIVKNEYNLLQMISERFGKPSGQISVEINDNANFPSYTWDGDFSIFVRKFYNLNKETNCNDCVLIIFGNMMYRDIIQTII